MANAHQKAIDYLEMDLSPDTWRKLAVQLAKTQPTTFNRIMAKVAQPSWQSQAMAQPTKVEAIKCVRSHTGWGLKESKEWIDERWPRGDTHD